MTSNVKNRITRLEKLVDKVCKLSDRHCRARIKNDREADFLASILHRFGCYPLDKKYPRTPEGIRQWAADWCENYENPLAENPVQKFRNRG